MQLLSAALAPMSVATWAEAFTHTAVCEGMGPRYVC